MLTEGYATTPKQKNVVTSVSVGITSFDIEFFFSFHLATWALQKIEPTPSAREIRNGSKCAVRNPSRSGGMHMRAICLRSVS